LFQPTSVQWKVVSLWITRLWAQTLAAAEFSWEVLVVCGGYSLASVQVMVGADVGNGTAATRCKRNLLT